MKAIVIGAGFIGTHLIHTLRSLNWEVDVYEKKWKRDGLTVTLDDVLGVDAVFNMAAARPNWEFVMKHPEQTIESNITLPGHLARLCKEAGIPLIHSSSSSVYGHSHGEATTEDTPQFPANTYGFQKATADSIIQDLNPKACLMRYFNVYGPGQDRESPYTGVISKFLQQHKEGKPLTVYGDGSQSRDFTFVEDVVDSLVRAYEFIRDKEGVHPFNIGGGKPTSVIEIADFISPQGERDFRPRPPGDVQKTQADHSKATEALGWQPSRMNVETFIKTQL